MPAADTAIPRQQALGLLARAPLELLERQLAEFSPLPPHTWLRKPETGMVMLRGRLGGAGQLFHLGETTVTRCTLRLASAELPPAVGVGTVRGTSSRHAELVAWCDALLQTAPWAPRLQGELLQPLAAAEQDRHARRAAEVGASKVDFYTLVRGAD